MSQLPTYYQFHSTTMDPCTMEKSAYEEARRTWLCIECAFPRPEVTTIDAIIQDSEPDNTPLNFISGCGLGLLRRDFMDALGRTFVTRDLYLGQVFGPEGLLPQWATFIGCRKIIVRGSKNVTFRHCSTCGRPMYFAMGTKYLSPKPEEGVAIFDGGNGSLVVSEEIGQSIAPNPWRKLSRTQLTVLQDPLDGLHELGVK